MSSPTTTTTTPNPTHNPQDRLSTLPDPLLTNILSRLPITTAITTSTLSTTFRHLWKTTTTISLTTASPTFTTLLTHHIIPHLTSTTLHLSLHLTSPTDFPDCHVIDSSFHTILTSIAIEKITIDVVCAFYEEVFYPPNSLLSSPPLKELELRGKIQFKLSLSDIEDIVQLPRLRRLMIDYLLDFPDWLGYLVKSCSVLEELDLAVSLDVVESLIEESIDFVCPELKRLRIDLVAVNKVEPTVVTLDVPRLEKIVIKDCTSRYCFASDPTGLMDACLDLRRSEEFEDNDEFDSDGGNNGDDDDEDYLRRMCRFVLGMSSVRKLELKVDSRMNVFSCLGCVVDDDGFVRMFRNLVRFEATLDGVGLSGWEGLLLSMQRFPNLKHLKVNMEGDDPVTENYDWCPPDIVPDCLTSKVKTVQICGLSGTDDDLKLAAFVLNRATVLEELRLDVFIKGMYDKILGMECVFCQSLFEIPRISSACEVVFSGRDVTTSSSTFKIDQFKGQMFSDA